MEHSEYFYLIQHKVSGKFYAGSSYRKNCHPTQFWTSYFTSSKTVKRIILEDGEDSFSVCYIGVRSNDDARDFEAAFLKSINAAGNSEWINNSNGHSSFRCDKHSDESKEKIRQSSLGRFHSEEAKFKMRKPRSRQARKPKAAMSQETKNKIGVAHKGRVFSLETIAKMSLAHKNISDETRMKMRQSHLGIAQSKVICPHCTKIGGVTNMKRWHFDNCKLKKDIGINEAAKEH